MDSPSEEITTKTTTATGYKACRPWRLAPPSFGTASATAAVQRSGQLNFGQAPGELVAQDGWASLPSTVLAGEIHWVLQILGRIDYTSTMPLRATGTRENARL